MAAGLDDLVGQCIRIVDLSYRCQCIGSMMGTHDQRLRFIIRDTADTHITFHFVGILVKFGTERCALNIVDRPVEAVLSEYHHAGTTRAQMGMIVCTEVQIKNTVLF